jgi:hypothetical protein
VCMRSTSQWCAGALERDLARCMCFTIIYLPLTANLPPGPTHHPHHHRETLAAELRCGHHSPPPPPPPHETVTCRVPPRERTPQGSGRRDGAQLSQRKNSAFLDGGVLHRTRTVYCPANHPPRSHHAHISIHPSCLRHAMRCIASDTPARPPQHSHESVQVPVYMRSGAIYGARVGGLLKVRAACGCVPVWQVDYLRRTAVDR